MIKVLVNGAQGRMGREVVKAVSAASDLSLVGQTDIDSDLSREIADQQPDVVVDFTVPDTVFATAWTIIDAGVRPVVGTTGLTTEEIHRLTERAQEQGEGGVIAPNFAIGAVLLMHYATQAAQYLPHVEIIELHHDRKLDAPSGTARLTAQRLAAARAKVAPDATAQGIEFRGGRVDDVPIHSVRLPGLVAHQEVIFGAQGQTLRLRHDSLSRESFMPGVMLAVREVMKLERLVVGLDALLGLK